jgi:Dna[CI] antecedent, DciA
MDRLAHHLEQELRRIGPAGSAGMAAIVRVWPAAVGEENARRAWPARLARDGTLHVNAADSVWAFQLGMLAETILDRLRVQLGAESPPALRFAPGPVPEPPGDASRGEPATAVSPGPEDVALATAAAAAIDDDDLRRTVARAAAASLVRARLEPRADR